MTNRTIVVGLVVLLGVFLMTWGGYTAWEQWHAVETFEPVDAEVVSVRVEDDGFPAVTYRYTVEGATYTSNDVFPGAGRRGGQVAKRSIGTYVEGQTVTAYYDPDDPARSFLVRQPFYTTPLLTLIVGVWVILFGLYQASPERGERVIGRVSSMVWGSGEGASGTFTRLRILLLITIVSGGVAFLTRGRGLLGTTAAVTALIAFLASIALRPTEGEVSPAAEITVETVPYTRRERMTFFVIFFLFVISMVSGVIAESLSTVVSVWVVGMGALFVGGGLYGLYRLFRELYTYRSTEGTVVAADKLLSKGSDRATYAPELGRFSRIPEVSVAPGVHYRYRVEGEEYENDRFHPGSGAYLFTRRKAEKILGQYAEGDVVDVYYHPDDPTDSFHTTDGIWRPVILYGFLLALGIALWSPLVGGLAPIFD